jgi:hypothetical protein
MSVFGRDIAENFLIMTPHINVDAARHATKLKNSGIIDPSIAI